MSHMGPENIVGGQYGWKSPPRVRNATEPSRYFTFLKEPVPTGSPRLGTSIYQDVADTNQQAAAIRGVSGGQCAPWYLVRLAATDRRFAAKEVALATRQVLRDPLLLTAKEGIVGEARRIAGRIYPPLIAAPLITEEPLPFPGASSGTEIPTISVTHQLLPGAVIAVIVNAELLIGMVRRDETTRVEVLVNAGHQMAGELSALWTEDSTVGPSLLCTMHNLRIPKKSGDEDVMRQLVTLASRPATRHNDW